MSDLRRCEWGYNSLGVNALITGGAQGIGRAIVEKFLARGNRLFVFDILPPDDERVAFLGDCYIQVDISSVDSIKSGFTRLLSILEENSLDILVNNAGIARDMLAIRMSEADWDAVLNVNLKGAFFCAQQALKRMVKQKKSYIVNISSVVGLVGNPGQVNYAASKAGLISVTKTLAKEYSSRNVLVNAVAPGFIQTQLTDKLPERVKGQALAHIPLKRFGTPDDVANVVSFLTSGQADYLTGQVISVDGGMIL
jgi:3-oxoacyl-[acyl-carrier protein] reductase